MEAITYGKYFWGSSGVSKSCADNLAAGHLYCLQVMSKPLEREALVILRTNSLNITAMLLDRVLDLTPYLKEWFASHSSQDIEKTYECNPVEIPERPRELLGCSNQSLFLYEYLASLKRKNEFSVTNTPKTISSLLNFEQLRECYEELERLDLLVRKGDVWGHTDSALSVSARAIVNKVSRITKFLSLIDTLTASVARDLNTAIKLGVRLEAKGNPNSKCPICSQLPIEKTEVRPDAVELLNPFHYDCPSLSFQLNIPLPPD